MKNLVILCCCFIVFSAQAQTKTVTKQRLLWAKGQVNLQVAPEWTLALELEERRFIKPGAQHQALGTVQAVYGKRGKDWKLGAGLVAFFQSPNDPEADNNLIRPEWRPQQFFSIVSGEHAVKFTQRFQVEERWLHNFSGSELTDGYKFMARFRYRVGVRVDIKGKTSKTLLRIDVNTEPHLQAGPAAGGQIFDQLRNSVTLSVRPVNNLWLSVGYLNWYQQVGHNTYFNRHIMTIGVSYDIKLYREKTGV